VLFIISRRSIICFLRSLSVGPVSTGRPQLAFIPFKEADIQPWIKPERHVFAEHAPRASVAPARIGSIYAFGACAGRRAAIIPIEPTDNLADRPADLPVGRVVDRRVESYFWFSENISLPPSGKSSLQIRAIPSHTEQLC
jgi:hypothetical protein